MEIAANEPPKLTLPVQPQAPPPKPASPFEDVKPVSPVQRPLGLPGASMDDAMRGAMSGRGGISSQGSAQIPSSGAELPTLLSDPKGVDFILRKKASAICSFKCSELAPLRGLAS